MKRAREEKKSFHPYTADLSQYAIISDETVMFGSSGVISLDSYQTHTVLDNRLLEYMEEDSSLVH